MVAPAEGGADGLVQVIILDIDGCLNAGVHAPYDLDAIAALRDFNAAARASPVHPRLTLCSGRPQPYVAAMAQFLHLDLPALCEHGGLLFSARDDHVILHPMLGPELRDQLRDVRQALDAALGDRFQLAYEAGKETRLTIFPRGATTAGEIGDRAQAAIDALGLPLQVRRQPACINVHPRGLHKGVGVRWLADTIGVPLAACAGFGDTEDDVPFLELVARRGAPRNAEAAVRAVPECMVGVRDAIDAALAFCERMRDRNRALLAGHPKDAVS